MSLSILWVPIFYPFVWLNHVPRLQSQTFKDWFHLVNFHMVIIVANRKYNTTVTLKQTCMFYQFESLWFVRWLCLLWRFIFKCTRLYKVYTCVSFTMISCPNCFAHMTHAYGGGDNVCMYYSIYRFTSRLEPVMSWFKL